MILLLVFAICYLVEAGRLWALPVWSARMVKTQGYMLRTSLSESPVGRFEKRCSEGNSKKSRHETSPGSLNASDNSGLIVPAGHSCTTLCLERSPSLTGISPSSDRAPPLHPLASLAFLLSIQS
jgi:hypothetical protein